MNEEAPKPNGRQPAVQQPADSAATATPPETSRYITSIAIATLVLVAAFGWKSADDMTMTWYLISLVGVLGTAALFGVFLKMRRGIGPQNLKAIGIVFVAVLVSLLAIADAGTESALGILGAIVGYLFGKDTSDNPPITPPPTP